MKLSRVYKEDLSIKYSLLYLSKSRNEGEFLRSGLIMGLGASCTRQLEAVFSNQCIQCTLLIVVVLREAYIALSFLILASCQICVEGAGEDLECRPPSAVGEHSSRSTRLETTVFRASYQSSLGSREQWEIAYSTRYYR